MCGNISASAEQIEKDIAMLYTDWRPKSTVGLQGADHRNWRMCKFKEHKSKELLIFCCTSAIHCNLCCIVMLSYICRSLGLQSMQAQFTCNT